jgi:hypothetical protein
LKYESGTKGRLKFIGWHFPQSFSHSRVQYWHGLVPILQTCHFNVETYDELLVSVVTNYETSCIKVWSLFPC